MRKNFLRKKVFNTVRDTTNKVYLQTYDKLVNITKQGAPLELMRKKKKKKAKNCKKQCRKDIGKVGCNQ